MALLIGIDPGQTGAIAFLGGNGAIFAIEDMPTDTGVSPAGVAEALRNYVDPLDLCPGTAVIEDVASMPGQGVASTFKFGKSFGVLLGVVAALGYEYHLVRPAVWKRAMGVTKEKGTSRRKAMQLWPGEAARFARVKDDGRAEAALIARYWWERTNR